ncbi:MAG: septum formation initiator family protein [Acidobacteria bacterium]|nr:MAG: septum formation initiator family protein [Acidobacteriota bacterium]
MAMVERNEPAGNGRKAASRGPQRRSFLTIALLFLAAALVLDGLVGDRGWLANRRARVEYERELQALEDVRQRNQAVREQIDRLLPPADPAAIEEIARRDLHLMKPGEKIFVIKDAPKPR